MPDHTRESLYTYCSYVDTLQPMLSNLCGLSTLFLARFENCYRILEKGSLCPVVSAKD